MALCLALCLLALGAVQAHGSVDRAQMTSRAVIDAALESRDITHDQAVLLKAYSVYAPWSLPPEYAGGIIDKCGLPAIEAIDDALTTVSPEVAGEVRSLRARPVAMTYIDTEHFRIHYDTSGTHKIRNWPDTTYRDAVATAVEECWTQEVTTLGFHQPPSDEPYPDNGGDGRYDIYVRALSGIYGYTQGEYYVESTPQNDATSYVAIDNDYTGFGYADPLLPMRVTVAHEFNHACQYAHDVDEPSWYKEATATWMEDYVYDSINDYLQYLSSFLTTPYLALDADGSGGLRIYGACVWNHYLSEEHGAPIVSQIWHQLESGTSTFSNIDLVLSSSYGTDLKEAVRQFSIWNFFTSSRNDGNHYQEGGTWPLVPTQAAYSAYPIVDGTPSATYKPDHLGCNYIRFNYPTSGWDGLHVAYDGPGMMTTPSAAYLNYLRQGSSTGYEYGGITLNGFGNGETIVYDWDLKNWVCLVVVNQSTTTNDMTYNYDVEEMDTAVEGGDFQLALGSASPNPFAASTEIAYTVPSGGGNVEFTVYDVAGRAVRTLVSGPMAAGDGSVRWDGLDDGGRPVASGVYFARLDVDGLTACGKLLVMK
jgi:hypothetical protein